MKEYLIRRLLFGALTVFIVSALIVCLIILNEVSDLILGISLQEMAGF